MRLAVMLALVPPFAVCDVYSDATCHDKSYVRFFTYLGPLLFLGSKPARDLFLWAELLYFLRYDPRCCAQLPPRMAFVVHVVFRPVSASGVLGTGSFGSRNRLRSASLLIGSVSVDAGGESLLLCSGAMCQSAQFRFILFARRMEGTPISPDPLRATMVAAGVLVPPSAVYIQFEGFSLSLP